MSTKWTSILPRDACREALVWAQTQPDLATAWDNCQRGDWMLWLAGRWPGPVGSASRKRLVLAACACARLALPYIQQGETRPLVAIEVAEAYCRGERPLAQVRAAAFAAAYAAAYAAFASAASASAAYAAYAAYAAPTAYAAYAAFAPAYAAAAAYAAYDAPDAAHHARVLTQWGPASPTGCPQVPDAAHRARVLAQCADLVRGMYPTPPTASE